MDHDDVKQAAEAMASNPEIVKSLGTLAKGIAGGLAAVSLGSMTMGIGVRKLYDAYTAYRSA